MPERSPFDVAVKPDWEGLRSCILMERTPARVHHIELFLDPEVQNAIAEQYGVFEGLDPNDPCHGYRCHLAMQSFLGYDYVRAGLEGCEMPLKYTATDDTAALSRQSGRSFVDEKTGPVTNWDEFERFPWPDPNTFVTRALDFYEKNLPEGMCVICGGGFAHYAEYLNWLMGYETLCYALYEQRDLVQAITDKLTVMFRGYLEQALQYDCVKIVWGSDDMGFRGGTLISPDDLRAFVLPGHKLMAEMSHARGLPYLLHSCGNLTLIMDDLIEDVKIDAKHSFEDTIEDVRDVKHTYGKRIALLGGIDVDFLCRASEDEVRARVRDTLDKCMAGGGYCLGSGNSVANYIPIENYLAMVDEGRKYTS